MPQEGQAGTIEAGRIPESRQAPAAAAPLLPIPHRVAEVNVHSGGALWRVAPPGHALRASKWAGWLAGARQLQGGRRLRCHIPEQRPQAWIDAWHGLAWPSWLPPPPPLFTHPQTPPAAREHTATATSKTHLAHHHVQYELCKVRWA